MINFVLMEEKCVKTTLNLLGRKDNIAFYSLSTSAPWIVVTFELET